MENIMGEVYNMKMPQSTAHNDMMIMFRTYTEILKDV